LKTQPVKLNKHISINATARKVFEFWADFRNFQQFIPIIKSIEILDDKRSRWIIHAPLGHSVKFDSFITEYKPGEVLAWESRHPDGYAKGRVVLSEHNGATQVELDYEYLLQVAWMQKIAHIVKRFGFPSVAFDHGLERIKDKIEKNIK